MAETKTAEAPATAAAEAPRPAGERRPLFSPAGLVVLFIVLMVEAAIVFAVTKVISNAPGAGGSSRLTEKEITLDLDPVTIEPRGAGGVGGERKTYKVTIRLNPKLKDLEERRVELAGLTKMMNDRLLKLISQNGPQYALDPDLYTTLKRDIRDLLNQELGATEPGKEIIDEVYIQRA